MIFQFKFLHTKESDECLLWGLADTIHEFKVI